MSQTTPAAPAPRPIRWWPAALIVLVAAVWTAWIWWLSDWPFQQRNLTTATVAVISAMLLVLWWTFFSRAPGRLRVGFTCGVLLALVAGFGMFRIRGVSGDLLPIIEFRWTRRAAPPVTPIQSEPLTGGFDTTAGSSFPQFLGPDRNGVLPGPQLDTNWLAHAPRELWRIKVGAAWSGFAVAGQLAFTQEQRDGNECVVAYELASGKVAWMHSDAARYHTTIAGEGPRATPTIASNRLFTLGGTGLLNCLQPDTGTVLWTRDVLKDSGGGLPEWGCAGAPLVAGGLVMVHSGLRGRSSLHAYRIEDGSPAWRAGTNNPSYAALTLAELAGTPQVLAFNDGSVSAHDPLSGALLWSQPWGNGNVVCSSPLVVATNRVLFSSGYGYGAQLFEVAQGPNGALAVQRVWKSIRMKSKFGHLFQRHGFLYGLDDGIFACVDLADGSLRWKEGRYGHGQGLLVGDLYLLMAESGELVLLKPTPEAPGELARFRVFNSKTWNPPALAGDLLLVRNDQEAACLRLGLTPSGR